MVLYTSVTVVLFSFSSFFYDKAGTNPNDDGSIKAKEAEDTPQSPEIQTKATRYIDNIEWGEYLHTFEDAAYN